VVKAIHSNPNSFAAFGSGDARAGSMDVWFKDPGKKLEIFRFGSGFAFQQGFEAGPSADTQGGLCRIESPFYG